MKKLSIYKLLFLIFLASSPNLFSAIERENVVAAYVYNFSKHILWPDDEFKTSFKISIIGKADSELISEFKKLARSKKVRNRRIKIEEVDSIEQIASTNVAYMDSPTQNDLEKYYSSIKGRPFLLVSYAATDPRLVMVNITEQEDSKLLFEVNKANLLNHGLNPLPELILHGGTEIDVAKLYREGQETLLSLESQLRNLAVNIESKQKKLTATERENITLEKQIQDHLNQLKKFNDERNMLIKDIDDRTEQMNELIKNLGSHEEALTQKELKLLNTEQQLDLKQEQIKTITERIEESNKIMAAHEKMIKSQEQEMAEMGEVITSQDVSLKQFRIVFVLSVLIVALIIFAYISKQKTNRLLQANQDELNRSLDELKLTQEELRKTVAKAETANQAKSRFLANMSHEIRSPLNAILGFSGILRENEGEATKLRYMNSIHSSGQILLSLIDDILDLSKVEAEKVTLQYSACPVKDLFEDIRQVFEEKAKDKGLDLITKINTNVPDRLILDEVRVRQILLNIISNAIKFTKNGKVEIDLTSNSSQSTDDSSRVDLIFTISDTGIGIKEKDREKIFEAFEQASGQKISEYGGTGLGLTICNQLVELMGGFIKLSDTLGGGTTFKIVIPDIEIASEEENAETEKKPNFESLQFEKSKILIVDDVDYNRELMMSFLEDYDLILEEAEDGNDALAKTESFKPDLILLDMKMPGMDGYEVSNRLESDDKLCSIPRVAITASALMHDEKVIRKICNGYLRKPISKADLLAELTKHLPHRKEAE